MPEGESENLFFKTPPGRRLSIWKAAILAAVAGRTAVERRPYRMECRHLGGANWESRHLGGGNWGSCHHGGVYRTMMFNPVGTNSS